MISQARLRSSLQAFALRNAARRGYEVSKHSAVRRQRMFDRLGVDLVVDVGAAVGHYGDELRQFGYGGDIASFEPLAGAYGELRAHAAGDPHWTARNVALGRDAGTARINLASNSDSSSLLGMLDEHRSAAPAIDYIGHEDITVSTLDAEFDGARHSASFLKIDTQGFELEVLAGGSSFLETCVGLQLELSFRPLYASGPLIHEVLGVTHDLGFTLAGLQPGFTSPDGEMLQADGILIKHSSIR